MNFWFIFFVIFMNFIHVYCCNDVIMEAIKKDDVEKVNAFLCDRFRNQVPKEMLNDGEGNVPSDDTQALLDWFLRIAVSKRAPGVVLLLLQVYGVDVNVKDVYGRTTMHLVAQDPYYCIRELSVVQKSKLENVTDILLEHNPDMHLRDYTSYTPFMWAVCCNNIPLVVKLIARGCSIHERYGINGENSLHMAVREGCLEMTEFLLENGAKGNIDDDGENALHIIFNTRALSWFMRSGKGQNDIGKLLLRSECAEEMLKQKRNSDQKTPVDIFFEQRKPNREILVDLLKILPNLDDKYALTALRIFHHSLEEDSSTWPTDNFLGYVKFAFNKYLEVLTEESTKEISYLDRLYEKLRILKSKNVDEIPAKNDVQHFMESDVYSLYVILKTRYQMLKHNRKEAAEEVEEFEECMRRQSALFQNDLVNSVAKGTLLEILPTHILSNIFLRWQYSRYTLRLSKIMALAQLTRGWSVEEMTDAAPKLLNCVEKRDIFCL